ncbi:MAG: hypothetical protein Fur0022_44220 [Anaerolineales bacterium]
MNTYQTNLTINDSRQVVLTDLPFRPGQRVKVIVTVEDEKRKKTLRELKSLFKTTQALPQAQAVSEEEILAEIEAYRRNDQSSH